MLSFFPPPQKTMKPKKKKTISEEAKIMAKIYKDNCPVCQFAIGHSKECSRFKEFTSPPSVDCGHRNLPPSTEKVEEWELDKRLTKEGWIPSAQQFNIIKKLLEEARAKSPTPTQEKEVEIAEDLWNKTMRDIEYGDGRDDARWQELVKDGFIAYAREALSQASQESYKQGCKDTKLYWEGEVDKARHDERKKLREKIEGMKLKEIGTSYEKSYNQALKEVEAHLTTSEE